MQARLERLEQDGVVSGYGPDVELAEAGYPVLAFATLEIAQGRLDEVTAAMAAIPSVVEAYRHHRPGDVHCRLAATSHEDLQRVLIEVSQIPGVARSTSVVALSRLVEAPRRSRCWRRPSVVRPARTGSRDRPNSGSVLGDQLVARDWPAPDGPCTHRSGRWPAAPARFDARDRVRPKNSSRTPPVPSNTWASSDLPAVVPT